MGVENWSENVVLVSLPGEPQTVEELTDVAELISEREDCDVVVDCSQIDRIGRSSCRLLWPTCCGLPTIDSLRWRGWSCR